MRKIYLLILFLSGWICIQAAPQADSALWAASAMARHWQLSALQNLPRWEAINLALLGQHQGPIPVWKDVAPTSADELWWTHAAALAPRRRDSLQRDLGLLELLSQTIRRNDEEVFRLLATGRAIGETELAFGLSRLQELAVALEDAGIVQDRLRYEVQQELQRAQSFAQSSAHGIARQHFRQGMSHAETIMNIVKTGRQQAGKPAISELQSWLRSAPLRRKAWREHLSAEDLRLQEPQWLRWERAMTRFQEAAQAWLDGDFPPAALHPQAGWTRSYQWLNHDLVDIFAGKSESIVSTLEDVNAVANTQIWLNAGIYPAFRPLGMAIEAPVAQEAPRSWIFVVDVSGSMQESHRLPLFRRSLAAWAAGMPEDHRISLISFADSHQLLLDHVPIGKLSDVLAESSRLSGSGETRVLPALTKAYELAALANEPTRVVLVSDGGLRYDADLRRVVESGKYAGVALDAVFLAGEDARYEQSLRQLVGLGGGAMTSLSPGDTRLRLGSKAASE